VAIGADVHNLHDVEAVIDKGACSALLARDLNADGLIITTDVSGIFLDAGLPTRRSVRSASPEIFARTSFAAGSMGPKVAAACAFVKTTGKRAVIGSRDQIEAMLQGEAGTQVRTDGLATL